MLTMKKNKSADVRGVKHGALSKIEPFKTLPFEALQEIEKQVNEKKYAKREYIFMQDDPAEYVWFVKDGHVTIANHSKGGRSQTLSVIGSGKMFGYLGMRGGEYGVYSIAETDVTVISISSQVFMNLMDKFPDVGKAVLLDLSDRLRQSKTMHVYAQETAEKRILNVLLKLFDEFGETNPMTRKEIAEMAGISVETCIRVFTRLEEGGLIESGNRGFAVHNPHGLRVHMEEI
jgi:CRP-like cAMP-binding protein